MIPTESSFLAEIKNNKVKIPNNLTNNEFIVQARNIAAFRVDMDEIMKFLVLPENRVDRFLPECKDELVVGSLNYDYCFADIEVDGFYWALVSETRP